jgi:Ca-activated chloride channel family protein
MKMALLMAGVALLIVALARPQWGESERKLTRRGIDLMIAIDVSTSMLASDIERGGGLETTRLARAKEQLRRLIVDSRGHRIGILAFAGAAFVQCPLTLDYGLALNILDSLEVGIVPLQGTSIGAAIDTAVDAFERADQTEGEEERPIGPQGERVLLLLTDGEDHDKATLQKAVARAVKAGIKIYAIGIGSDRGAPITMRDGTVKKDEQGRVVTTRVDYETLSKVALETGGAVVRGTATGNLDLQEVQKQLDSLEQSIQKSATKTVYEERFVPVLVFAMLLLVWEMFQGDRREPAPEAPAER